MPTTAPIPSPPPTLLSQLNPGRNLQEALSAVEAQVRASPANLECRWALAELLCVLGQWERALKQLQTGINLAGVKGPQSTHWQAKAQLLRGLIRAEAQRSGVFAGQLLPVPVVDRPQWMEDLARAIGLNAKGEHAQADTLRRAALDAAPVRAGVCAWLECQTEQKPAAHKDAAADAAPHQDSAFEETLVEQPFDWISDTDTRLGSVCEFIVAGGYRWVAYADIASLQITRPSSLLDLVWLPATLQLSHTQAGAQALHGFVPARYSGTQDVAAEAGGTQRDALMLSRLTRWQDVGETGVFALGQKTLMTPAADIPLLDIRSLRIGNCP